MKTIEEFLQKYKSNITYCGMQNSYLKFVKNLNNNLKSNPKQEIVIEGIFQHQLAIANNLSFSCSFFCPETITSDETIKMLYLIAEKTDILLAVSKKVLEVITEVENNFGIVSVVKIPKYELEELSLKENSTIVVLDGVEIPGNLGTILRACDSAGVSAVFLTNKKTRITHPKCVRSSLGSVFTLPIFDFESTKNCIDYLNKNNFEIILADTRAKQKYFEHNYQGKIAVVMGSERFGIVKEWYANKYTGISIPQLGKCDSLNVASACTIIIYEARMKQSGLLKRQ